MRHLHTCRGLRSRGLCLRTESASSPPEPESVPVSVDDWRGAARFGAPSIFSALNIGATTRVRRWLRTDTLVDASVCPEISCSHIGGCDVEKAIGVTATQRDDRTMYIVQSSRLPHSIALSWWYARRELNPRPLGPQPSALSPELRAHSFARIGVYQISARMPPVRRPTASSSHLTKNGP